MNNIEPVTYTPIGIIHSEHRVPNRTPIQPAFAEGCAGQAELLPEYEEGLAGLDGFSHITLLYNLHQSEGVKLTVVPFMDDKPTGLFSTRHPCRPNSIGLSTVRLLGIEGTTLFLDGVDVLDGTPLLDIKPFIPRFDSVDNAHGGWTEEVDETIRMRRGRRMDD